MAANTVFNSAIDNAAVKQMGSAEADSAEQANDFIFDPSEERTAQRYLGHRRSAYGFVLETPSVAYPEVFILPLNPQTLDQDEEAAVTIIPTQGGGKYVENRGSIFKDIMISGTTGFLPNANMKPMKGDSRTLRDVNPATARQWLREQAGAKVSGYAVFHTLRSMFRKYWQIKKNGLYSDRLGTCMYFINMKDNETWWVEPINFRMSRTSKNPLGYPYQIKLRTLARGMNGIIIPRDPSAPPEPAEVGGWAKMLKLLAKVAGMIRDAVNKVVKYLNLITDTVMGFVDSVLDVAYSILDGLTQVTAGVSAVLGIPKSIVDKGTLLIDDAFDAAKGIALLLPTDFIDGLTSMKQQFDHIGAQPALFKSQWQDRWGKTLARFNDATGESTGASSYSLATVSAGDSPQSMSMRLFGEIDAANQIISINNLSYPYFANSQSEKRQGVLGPGDQVLVPVRGASGMSSLGSLDYVSSNPSETAISVSATTNNIAKPSDTNIWRDDQWVGYTVRVIDGSGAGQVRQISSNGSHTVYVSKPWDIVPSADSLFQIYYSGIVASSSGADTSTYGVDLLLKDGDLASSSSGDVQTVSGMPNFMQALDIKMKTERRGLLLHPWFGFLMFVGSRGTPEYLFSARYNAEKTILSDSRVSSIRGMSISLVKDVYTLTAYVVPKGANSAQPINKAL